MFILIEIIDETLGETEIQAHGPFNTRDEAISHLLGDTNSILRQKLDREGEITINNTVMKIVELSHPIQ